MKHLLIILFFISSHLFAQKNEDKAPWADTNYVSVNLLKTINDKKIVKVVIGEKAIIYLSETELKKAAIENSNDFNDKDELRIIHQLDSASLKSDTIVMDQFLSGFDYLISDQLKKGNVEVFYKKQKSFVSAISHRLEKYGMYAHRFFYLPDKRPFFEIMEFSGIIENNKYFSDPGELEKLGEKLASLLKK